VPEKRQEVAILKSVKAFSFPLFSIIFFAVIIITLSLSLAANAEEIGSVTITGNWVNIRSGPGLDYSKVHTLPEGTVLPALKSQNGWYNVVLPSGQKGWVIDDYAELKYSTSSETGNNLKVKVNGQEVKFDTQPFIDKNDRTMVPIRFVAEELGAVVGWNEDEQKVSIVLGDKKVFLWIEKKSVQVNDSRIEIDTQPIIKNERTMVPLRFVSEAFGATVGWDGKNNTVTIELKNKDVGGIDASSKKKVATITGNIVNIRSGAGVNFTRIDQFPAGTELEVLDEGVDSEGRTWYKVKLPLESQGWIAGWLVDISIIEDDGATNNSVDSPRNLRRKALVIGNVVNIRSGPGLGYEVISQVSKGDSLLVLGSSNEWYEVRLNDGSQGWIHGSLVSIQSVNPSRGSSTREDYLSTLPKVDEELDYPAIQNVILKDTGHGVEILIQGNEPLQHSAFVLQNPKRLVIDIPGTKVALAEESLEQSFDNKFVKSIRVGQFEEDTSRIVIDLLTPVSYNVEELFDGEVLSFFLQKSSLQGKVIVIDPGHGSLQPGNWADPGAIGPAGTHEADVVLEIAKKTAAILNSQGATVIMTRTGDTALSLAGRAAVANDMDADIFVSIHANANPNPAVNGSSVYYYASDWNSTASNQRAEREKLARLIQYYIVKYAATRDEGIIERGFKVLRETEMPSVLVETAFITNPREEKLLASEAFQNKLAQGIAQGISSYFLE
jgi:N-acetylmuramoyl-L-alanine amidase